MKRFAKVQFSQIVAQQFEFENKSKEKSGESGESGEKAEKAENAEKADRANHRSTLMRIGNKITIAAIRIQIMTSLSAVRTHMRANEIQ